MSTLLQLPRELRNLIYDYYFAGDGGYTHNFETNKLSRADNQPIELALVLSCRQIANETRGLALRINTLRFTTFHSAAMREEAGLIHAVIHDIQYRKASLLNCALHPLLNQEHAQTLKNLYPQFTPIVDHWQSHGEIDFGPKLSLEFGEAPSMWRDFVVFTMGLVSQQPGFLAQANIKRPFEYSYEGDKASVLNEARPEPWKIFNTAEIARLHRISGVSPRRPFVWPSSKYTYSAASVALRFLSTICKPTRDHIRKISLLEDRESIAFPESHGRGFIAICQDHRKLRVERLVNLWGNAFPVATDNVSSYLEGDQTWIDDGLMDHHRCAAKFMTKAVATWMMEAMILLSLGMPHGSFTLTLDGDPVSDLSSRAFRIIQRDAAWQTALESCYARGLLPQPSWFDLRLETPGFMFDRLPEAVRDLSMNESLIRTNFPVDSPFDAEQLLREHQGWSAEDWKERWASHEPSEFQTEAPLPPWYLLRWGHVIR